MLWTILLCIIPILVAIQTGYELWDIDDPLGNILAIMLSICMFFIGLLCEILVAMFIIMLITII